MKNNLSVILMFMLGISTSYGQTWMGTTSTDWEIPSNWSTGAVPNNTSEVIITNAPRYPKLTKDVTVKRLIFKTTSSASSLDLSGHTLTTKEILLIEASTSQIDILSTGTPGTLKANGLVQLNGTTQNINIYAICDFSMTKEYSDVTFVTFYEIVHAKYTSTTIEITNWNGNIFKKELHATLNGIGRWQFGYSNRDVFEADVVFNAIDNIVSQFIPDRKTSYYFPPIKELLTYPPYSEPTAYIQPPYYVPNSGIFTIGEKNGFADYPRVDNLPTTGVSPQEALDNRNQNITNAALNQTDVQTSKDNFLTANEYPKDVVDNKLDPAREALDNAIKLGNNSLNKYFYEPAYLGDVGNVVVLYNNYKTILESAEAYMGTIISIREAAKEAYIDRTNTPIENITIANDALNTTRQAFIHEKQIYEAIHALQNELIRVNRIYNQRILTITNAPKGRVIIAAKSSNNEFRGNTIVNIRGKAQVYMFENNNSGGVFKGNFTVNNLSTGLDYFAFSFYGNQDRNQEMVFEGNVTINNGDGTTTVGDVKFYNNSRRKIKIIGNLTLNSFPKSGRMLFGEYKDIEVIGKVSAILQGAQFHLKNTTFKNIAPITFHAKNDILTYFSGKTSFAGPVTFIDESKNEMYISKFDYDIQKNGNLIFQDDVTLRSITLAKEKGIRVAYGSKATFNGNIIVENLASHDFNSEIITFGAGRYGTSKVDLASGKTISIGPLGFDSGYLLFRNFHQHGITPQKLHLKKPDRTISKDSYIYTEEGTIFEGNIDIQVARARIDQSTFQGDTNIMITELGGENIETHLAIKKSHFLGKFVGKASQISLQENIFDAETAFERLNTNNNKIDRCYGGNIFKDDAIIKSSSSNTAPSSAWVWADKKGDTFEANATYVLNGASYLVPALNGKNYYQKNIIITGTHGRTLSFSGYPGVSGLETLSEAEVSTLGIPKGEVIINGASDQTISNKIIGSTMTNFRKLVIQQTSSDNNVFIDNDMLVTTRLSLLNGVIKPIQESSPSTLIIGESGTSDEGKEESYVNGPVRKMIGTETSFIFPTGKRRLGKIAIQEIQNHKAGDYFTAEYFPNPYPIIEIENPTIHFPKLNNVSVLEHWILDRNTEGKTNAKVQLYWTSTSFSDMKSRPTDDLVIARFDATKQKWENRGGTIGSQDITTPNIQTQFSPWTFGSRSGFNPLPVNILSFDGQKINNKNQLTWTTENNPITKQFEVQRSLDNQNFMTFKTVEKKNLANPVLVYKAIDAIKTSMTVYYRLKLINKDDSTFSKVISIGEDTIENPITIYPNPFAQNIKVTFDLEANESYEIVVRDMLGHMIQAIKGISIGNTTLDLEHLPKGTYVLQIVSSSITQTKKIVKQ